MAIYLKVMKCSKGHPLFITNGIDYFCKICGVIEITDLRRETYRKIKDLKLRRFCYG